MSIGIISAVFIGIGMGCHKPVESFFNPILSLAAKIPPTAMLAVFFVISGTDMPLFVTMIVFGILPSLAQSVYLAIKDIHEELINKAHTLGCSYFEIIINVVIPLIMPKIIDSIRLQIGPAMVYLLAAEMIVSDVGFGYRIRMQSRLMNMDVVYIYLSFLAFFGYFVDYSLKLIQKYSCPWFDIEKKD
jgi:NitT/TauT family transport system permease protein